jgi:cephalosporin-C deacetylase-like acetyl esterase
MADLGNSTPATRLDPFHVHKATYKKVGNHEIQAAILIPKEQKPGKHPLLVKIHGGLFVSLCPPIIYQLEHEGYIGMEH